MRTGRRDELSSSNSKDGDRETMRDDEDDVEMAGHSLREKGFPNNRPGSSLRGETSVRERVEKTFVVFRIFSKVRDSIFDEGQR